MTSKRADERADGREAAPGPAMSRRDFACSAGAAALLLAVGGGAKAFGTGGPVGGPASEILRPPGGQDEGSLLALCIRCDRCRSACPTDCISVAQMAQGFINTRTPMLDFHQGSCTFCGRCTHVCPTGALAPFATTASTFNGEPILVPDIAIGIAEVERDLCIAWQGGGCTVCVDLCPYGAITLSASSCPEVDLSLCNGCGICENRCPSASYLSYSGSRQRGINVVKGE